MTDYADNQHTGNSILIWDSEGVFPTDDGTTLLWRSYDCDGSADVISIPQLVEDNAYRLRSRYLAWIYELGETRIRSKRLVDHLQLRQGFSYWWMTLIAEKCNFTKSLQIDNVIRFLAFDQWAKNRNISRVVLATANQQLSECFCAWCLTLGVVFEWNRILTPVAPKFWIKGIYHARPHSLRGLSWLCRYLIDRWPLRGVGLKAWQQTDGRITFISYLFNLVPEAAKRGHYESRYWGHLPDALQSEAGQTNWLHLYVKDGLLPISKHAADKILDFNDIAFGKQHHVTLDTFLSPLVVLLTLRDWCRMQWTGIVLSNKLHQKQHATNNFWPLLEDDWLQSMFGSVAMCNLLFFNLFESALKSLPPQKVGVYLQENQGWEFALIHLWRAAGHGRLIGTPHSTVRFWDLRYFFDPRSYQRTGQNDLPMPDQVAYNGQAELDAYKNGEYPVDDLVEVEALRYLHLVKFTSKALSVVTRTPLGIKGGMRVLVLGDYLHSNTMLQMNLLEEAALSLPENTVFIVKPHPACSIQSADYPLLKMTVTMDPISDLLDKCDVAYSSAVTSAAVDVYCAGVPIVSVLDPNTLNLSPLRGCAGVIFASTPNELVTALMFSVTQSQVRCDRQNFFILDTQLPRWIKLLLAFED